MGPLESKAMASDTKISIGLMSRINVPAKAISKALLMINVLRLFTISFSLNTVSKILSERALAAYFRRLNKN